MWCLLRFSPALNYGIAAIVNFQSGAQTDVVNARWNGWGNLTVESMVLLAPNWPGASQELVRVNGISVEFEPWQLLLGEILVRDIHVDSAAVNIAERSNAHGIFNLSALKPRAGSGSSPISIRQARLDRLQIASLTVDAKNNVNVEGQHIFQGDMKPNQNSPTDFKFELREVTNTSSPLNQRASNLELVGNWNQITFEYVMTVTGLSFDQSLLPLLPKSLQPAWRDINLTGSIEVITVSGSPARPVNEATLKLQNVQANIPFPGYQTEWVRYEPKKLPPLPDNIKNASDLKDPPRLQTGFPRMQVQSGTVRFTQNMLKFENFIGQLASTKPRSLPVPIQLSLDITLPSQDQPTSLEDTPAWFEDAFERSGVEATIQIHHFAFTKENEKDFDGVELPKSAVQVLGNLLATSWDIDLNVNISRAMVKNKTTGSAAMSNLTHKGKLDIRSASGGYFLFPYLLSDVTASILLDNNAVKIEWLKGKGSEGKLVEISGTVTEPGDDAGVDLQITAADLPIDEALKKSFLFGPKKVFELLYDHQAQTNLIAAGLLKPNEFPFQGRCTVHLRVERAVKGGANVKTTGDVSLREANVICSRFPYPVHVTAGSIILEDTVVRLPEEKWKLTTSSNATVTIGGSIDIPRDGEDRKVFPDLTITLEHDSVNELLLAAIPFETKNAPAVPGWPGSALSPAARMLKQINLQGELNAHGKIGALADETTTWDFNLALDNGTITPRNKTENGSSDADQILPSGFNLTKVAARVNVTDDFTSLSSLTGLIGDGQVKARGFAKLDSSKRWFEATANNVPIDRWVFGFLPADTRDESIMTWGGCNPTGTISVDVHLQDGRGLPAERRVMVDPTNVQFDLDPGMANIQIPCGYFELIDDSLHVHHMRLEFLDMEAHIGYLEANGSVDYGLNNKSNDDAITMDAHFHFIDSVFFEVLPSSLRESLRQLAFQSNDTFEITNSKFTIPITTGKASFSGDILLCDAQLQCGPWLDHINGLVKLSSDIGGPIYGMRLDFKDASLSIHNRNITQIEGTLYSDSTNGNFTIDTLKGYLYGGRICMDARVLGQHKRPWNMNLGVVGTDLSQVLKGGVALEAPNTLDGNIAGMLTLGGEMDGDQEREGRGMIHGSNAKLGDLPLALRLLQVMQFMPPLSQTLDDAKIDFYLRDKTIRFEKFDLSCPTLQLLGSGSVDIDTGTISMRFKNRGIIPIASDIFGAATDLLLAVDVKGLITDPNITVSPLPILGADPSRDHMQATSTTPTATP